ncbi:uncharacterized protein LOC126673284 [Mercurialis annua]|uniref:uncharacterized protein LOC126673284 n=1 Tax=Mercurialis annua TaxID=3986 RepID=UPI00216007BD|nr:uncharacterized protein LOC126673284 [Mercurialis annua]
MDIDSTTLKPKGRVFRRVLTGYYDGAVQAIPVIPGNRGWFIFATFIAHAVTSFATPLIFRRFRGRRSALDGFLFMLGYCATHFSLLAALCQAYRRGLLQRQLGRDVPASRCELGRLAKSANFLISIVTAVLARRYLAYQLEIAIVIASLTMYAHAMIRFVCCIFLDLCLRDLLLAALMHMLVFVAFGNSHAFIAALIFCGALILHQFFFYTPVPDISVEERIEAGALRLLGHCR